MPVALDFALLCGAIEEIPYGVATTRNGEIHYANAKLERMLGADAAGIEGRRIESLFDPDTYQRVLALLRTERVFDGRISLRRVDGREVEAELYAERYTSEVAGVGGFLLVRDVSFELGALARLVDQLGGALFRVRVRDGRVEQVSPAIGPLLGLEPSAITDPAARLHELVAPGERDRLQTLYRRLTSGELPSTTATVAVRGPRGGTVLLQLVATGRRDAAGAVSHIEGVVAESSSRGSRRPAVSGPSPEARSALVTLSRVLLREASEAMRSASTEIRTGRASLETADRAAGVTAAQERPPAPSARTTTGPFEAKIGRITGVSFESRGTVQPPSPRATPSANELAAQLARAQTWLAAADELNRRVRVALAGRPARRARVGEVLSGVRSNLALLCGDDVSLTLEMEDQVIELRFDELHLALVCLGLRAHRVVGGGPLRLNVRVGASRGTAWDDLLIELSAVAIIPATTAPEPEAEPSRAAPSSGDYGSLEALVTLLHDIGGSLDADEHSPALSRSLIRLHVAR